MVRVLIKLALVAFVANAGWRIGSAYISYFKFKDAVREAAAYQRTGDAGLRQRIMSIGADLDIPVEDDDLKITTVGQQTVIAGAYTKPIDLLPGYALPWRFSWSVEVYSLAERTPSGLRELKQLEHAPDSPR